MKLLILQIIPRMKKSMKIPRQVSSWHREWTGIRRVGVTAGDVWTLTGCQDLLMQDRRAQHEKDTAEPRYPVE